MLPILTPLTWLPHQLVCMLSAEIRFFLEQWMSLKPWWWSIIGDQIIDAEVGSSTIVDLTFFPAGKSYFWEALDKVWGLIIAGATALATDVQCYIILKGAAKSLTPLRLDFQELKLCTYRVSGAIHSTWLQYYIQNMGKTLHIYTQSSKSWNIYFGGDLAWLYLIVKILK